MEVQDKRRFLEVVDILITKPMKFDEECLRDLLLLTPQVVSLATYDQVKCVMQSNIKE